MSSYVTRKTPGDTTWFTHDRFGMFIHWGLYAMPARHEWVKTRERMTDDHYDRYFRHFDPDLYDPRQWARMAKAAGMKYAVMTAKHHEGFCMFDSVHRLSMHQYTGRPGPHPGVCGGVSGRGAPGGLLLFPH